MRDTGIFLRRVILASLALGLTGLTARLVSMGGSLTDFPFSINWSESGRIFNAWQIYAGWLGRGSFSWPWLDPARSLLDGLILLIPGVNLWYWRAWITLLSLGTHLLTAWLIVKLAFANFDRELTAPTRSPKFIHWLLAVWGMLFLLQGPVYYHLACVILPVLLFFDQNLKRNWLNLVIILLASVWAGLTRPNWFLMPALCAITLYILFQPVAGSKWRYLKLPLIWALLSLLISLGVHLCSIRLASQPSFLSSTWAFHFDASKLLPNSGFLPGLLVGSLLAIAPISALFVYQLKQHGKHIHPMRLACLLLIGIVLWVGGTIVSLRAGGGYDLHNYDAFLVFSLLTGMCWLTGGYKLESGHCAEPLYETRPMVLPLLLVLPTMLSLWQATLPAPRPYPEAELALNNLNHLLNTYAPDDEDVVLLIDHRHLVLLGFLGPVPLESQYEKIELMEMALANQQDYFSRFQQDLAEQKYQLIVAPLLWNVTQSPEDDKFWFENNAWVKFVSVPILKYYQPVYINPQVDVGVYIPKEVLP